MYLYYQMYFIIASRLADEDIFIKSTSLYSKVF